MLELSFKISHPVNKYKFWIIKCVHQGSWRFN